MTKNELENNILETIKEVKQSNKIFEVIPSDKIYPIHNDLRKYHNKWDKKQVIELADTFGIENFYTTAQYLTRAVPIVGAGLIVKGYTEAGAVTAGVSLYADYLISSGKEKLFKSEEKKRKLTELSKDIENLYDRYQELIEILKPLHNFDSSPELNKLLQSLREELEEILKKGEDKSSKVKELILLNNGIKVLESWNNLSLTAKAKRNEHGKIKHLITILQTAISEYKQGITNNEIEKRIMNGMQELSKGVKRENNQVCHTVDLNDEEKEIEHNGQLELVNQQLQHPKND
ncbi:12683_t:CDS:2 [Funneliformis geosporum]|uniref:3482_t:CDS:1 n=1 Tax=Funneliformis geosporum TaxID=1117311 RepID=A0A9W4SQX5_9GLOM|nr:12683_t:CDS:2 [Funneliformis geosporum]CAI2178335.1 3482_t:CDS:2 [Funneliformis geosporum]